jgi:opacity protein-like surface antigen
MKRITMAAALILMAFAANAQDEADDTNSMQFGVGIAAAFSDYDGDSSFPVKDSGVGLQLHADARINKWFGIEAGYYNSGGFDTDLDPNESDGDVELTFSGLNLSAVGYIPIGDIELLGKIGMYDYDIDLTVLGGDTKLPGSLGHATGLAVGAGAIIDVSEHVGIRAVVDWYDVDNATLWAVSLGVDYRF